MCELFDNIHEQIEYEKRKHVEIANIKVSEKLKDIISTISEMVLNEFSSSPDAQKVIVYLWIRKLDLLVFSDDGWKKLTTFNNRLEAKFMRYELCHGGGFKCFFFMLKQTFNS